MQNRHHHPIIIIFFIILSTLSNLRSQVADSLHVNSISVPNYPDRLRSISFCGSVCYISTFIGLNEVWYSDFQRSGFHMFNDNAEWLGVDKAGHVFTSYCLGKKSSEIIAWGGVKNNKAIWVGGLIGLTFQSTIELLDGYSSGWGASTGDMAANALGTMLLISQQYLFHEQRFFLKFSYSPTVYPGYRPEVLGSNNSEKILKDYNGQTYWLSFNPFSLVNKETKFPKWLNFSLGYGADGMTGGDHNPLFNKEGIPIPDFKRQRQFYLSFDIDLNEIKTKSKILRGFFDVFGFLKIPAPVLEINSQKIKFHPLYF